MSDQTMLEAQAANPQSLGPEKEQEIAAEQAKQEALKVEVARLQEFVKDPFFTTLIKVSKSVEDAKALCKTLSMFYNQAFSKRINVLKEEMQKMKASEFDLEEFMKEIVNVDPQGNVVFDKEMVLNQVRELAVVFKEENLADTDALLQKMVVAIDSFVQIDNQKRTLDVLPTNFL